MNRPRFEIVEEHMGGRVRVLLGRGEPTGELGKFLSHGLTDWTRKRPHLRVRFALPINWDGDTVELHAWYDQVLFPDICPMADPEAGGAGE